MSAAALLLVFLSAAPIPPRISCRWDSGTELVCEVTGLSEERRQPDWELYAPALVDSARGWTVRLFPHLAKEPLVVMSYGTGAGRRRIECTADVDGCSAP